MQSFNLNHEHIMKDVYSYPFPEVRDLLRKQDLQPEFMLNTLPIEQASGLLACYNFRPELELPARTDGTVDLDEIHLPVIERIRARNEVQLPGLGGFENAYPNHGSSQAMFTMLAEWKAKGKLDSLAVVDGEYEGYSAYAEALNIPVARYDNLDAELKDGQVWFVSNPSAVDGNWIDETAWEKFVAAGHEIVLDAAYVGLTSERPLDVSAPNIRAVLTSPSKIFGVFRYRNTGITYTREPVQAMYGTKWFKDVPALLETLNLYETFGPSELPNKYRSAQEFICRQLTDVVEAEVKPADVLLLANTSGPIASEFEQYKRGANYRFGLTKLFEDIEIQNAR